MLHYSNKWGLKINVNKSKICVYEKGKQTVYTNFYIVNKRIEILEKNLLLS
jgi:hypothetical protein